MNNQFDRTLYSAFDLYPSSKGSATHIGFLTKNLFDIRGGGTLFCLGNDILPNYQEEGNVRIVRFSDSVKNYLERGLRFSKSLYDYTQAYSKPELIHYRDLWSGIAFNNDKTIKKVYEVNALMSIELAYRYSGLKASTIKKISDLEKECIQACDIIITPSKTTAALLKNEGVISKKIKVVPNTAEAKIKVERTEELKGLKYFIYFGALQKWQGVTTILKAISLIPEEMNVKLVICSSNKSRAAKQYHRICRRLKIEDRVIWYYQINKAKLNGIIRSARGSLVPLEECSRNIIQGCSPLKVFESVVCNTPIIASDLPVVHEILPQDAAQFIQAGRPEKWARKMMYCIENPKKFRLLSDKALKYFNQNFNSDKITKLQMEAYESISAI